VVVMETTASLTAAIRISSMSAVEATGARAMASGGEHFATGTRTFAEIVADLVGTGEVASFLLAAGVHLDGEVLGVGQDVVIVRAGGSQAVYVALDSLNELAWSTSVG
jgi:hypothetical protein